MDTGFTTTNYVGEGDIFGEYTFAYSQFGNIVQGNLEKVFAGSSTVKEALDASQATAVAVHSPLTQDRACTCRGCRRVPAR